MARNEHRVKTTKCRCRVKREPGYLYFVNKVGNIVRVKMAYYHAR